MPAFTAVGAYVAGTIFGLVGTAAVVVGALVATGAAYITSRIINGNPNKGNNSASASQGGRIQIPPATNNKIPVVYGNAYINGIITDARLITTDNKINDTMYYCIVLSETCQSGTPTYTIDDIYWNDLRLTFDATSPYKVKDGRKNVDNPDGITEDFIDTNFISDGKNLVEMRVYAGGSAAANQIFPTTGTTPAYTFWAGNDGSWDSTYAMKGLVFAIVKVTYNGEKGFTGLPNMTFRMNNTVSNPADVWYDYMTGQRYGAGIDAAYIDSTAKTAWKNFCDEDITYTDKDGTTNQSFARYAINGPIDTSRPVKENIDIIMQNAGAWLSYNVATGLWSPIIKKAVTAGELGLPATYFTASKSVNTLTVTNFPAGRIEAGQLLYNSGGTLIGTITAQLTPTAGETAGQIGRYTVSGASSTITPTTFYTLPAQMLAFSDDNIISGISISSTRLDDLYNEVEAEFYDKHNKDQKAYARNEIDAGDRNPNEPDNQLRLSLDLCNNSMQADLLGQLELRQSRDDLVVEFTTNFYGIQAQAGDVISITSELYDWNPKYFRVMRVKEQETEEGGLVAQIQALEYNPDVYTVEPITEFTTSANIGIGVYGASPNLPQPPVVFITEIDTDVAIPNFQMQIQIPTTGGPYDEIELYYTEGWDPFNITGTVVPGTGSNGAPVGKGLLTVTASDFGAINVGDDFTVGSTEFTITEQLTNDPVSKTYASGGAIRTNTVTLNNTTGLKIGNLLTGTGLGNFGANITAIAGSQVTLSRAFDIQAAGTYAVFGGLGTYVVDTSATLSGTTQLFDLPVDSDYVYLKKVSPEGNNPTFTNGETITVVITEVPANTQTYRRWFLKARMGIKKRFGSFSSPTITDRDGNFRYTPNPVASGNLSDLQDVNITDPTEGNSFYYDATTSKWRNTNIITVDDVNLRVGINNTNPNFALDVFGNVIVTGDYRQTLNNLYLNVNDASVDVAFHFNSGRSLKWDHSSQRFELNGDTYISDDLTVDGGNINLNGTAQAGVKPFLTFATQADGTNSMYGIRGMSTVDDPWFVGGASTGDDAGYLEIATGDNSGGTNNGGEIYVRQYNGSGIGGAPWYGGSGTIQNTLTLLDNIGNTTIPNSLLVNDVLFVDHVNNRVGINNLSPNFALDVSGDAWISNTLYVSDITTGTGEDLNISAAAGENINITGTGSGSPLAGGDITLTAAASVNPVTLVRNTGLTTSATRVATLRTNSTGTPGVGLGGQLVWEVETSSGNYPQGGYIETVSSDIASNNEKFTMRFGLMNRTGSATAASPKMELDSVGNLQIDGTLEIDGNQIKNSAGTTVLTFSGTNLVTTAGDIAIGGNTIRDSANTAAIELSGANVTVEGTLEINGNQILSSTGATAITLTGNDVAIAGELNVDSGTLYVNKTTNRVGVKTVSPTVELDVIGDIKASNRITTQFLDVTGAWTSDITFTGNVTATVNFDLGVDNDIRMYGESWVINTSTSVTTTIDFFEKADFRSGRYNLTITQGTKYEMVDVYVIHNGSTVNIVELNSQGIGGSITRTIAAAIVGSRVNLNITVNANTTLSYKAELAKT